MLCVSYAGIFDRIRKRDISVTAIFRIAYREKTGIKVYITKPEITDFRYP